MNDLSKDLKKRTFADMIISIILCAGAAAYLISMLVSFLNNGMPEYITNMLYTAAIILELIMLISIFLEIRKKGKPFSKSVIIKLRIMAVLLMIVGCVPNLMLVPNGPVEEMTDLFTEEISSMRVVYFGTQNLLVILLGVIIGIISEVFVYGGKLQEDNDLIA